MGIDTIQIQIECGYDRVIDVIDMNIDIFRCDIDILIWYKYIWICIQYRYEFDKDMDMI